MRVAILAVMAAGLMGCHVTSPSAVSQMMGAGELRAAPHPTDAQRIVVHLAAHDWARALDDAATQQQIVETMLTRQCGAPHIEDRQVTQIGALPLGQQRRLYTLTVHCPNGVTSRAER